MPFDSERGRTPCKEMVTTAAQRFKTVAWSVLSFLAVPVVVRLALESTEYETLSWAVDRSCVWCYYGGSLGTTNCYDNWTSLWRWLRAAGPDDDFLFFVGGTTLFHMGVFWTYCGVLGFIDLKGPAWLRKYKVQQKHAEEPLDPAKFWRGVRRVLFNNVFVGVPLTCLAYSRFEGRLDDPLPSLGSALAQCAGFVVVEEVLFYYTHRLFHHRLLYKHVHAVHHEWQQPVGLVALYAHPLEHALSNLLPAVAGPLFWKTHCGLFWLFISIGICTTINTHCGYHFPGFLSPRAHDYHHEKFTEMFGVMGWLDTLHGTNKTWLAAESNTEYHETYYTLTPPWTANDKKANAKAA